MWGLLALLWLDFSGLNKPFPGMLDCEKPHSLQVLLGLFPQAPEFNRWNIARTRCTDKELIPTIIFIIE